MAFVEFLNYFIMKKEKSFDQILQQLNQIEKAQLCEIKGGFENLTNDKCVNESWCGSDNSGCTNKFSCQVE